MTYSPTRSRSTWKPRIDDCPLQFFNNGEIGTLISVGNNTGTQYTIEGRTKILHQPYSLSDEIDLIGKSSKSIIERNNDTGKDSISIGYSVEGGFDNNCIVISWAATNASYVPGWIAVKTFTGFQLKYLEHNLSGKVVFALSEDDAFVYCNKQICEECNFKCKLGFQIYVPTQEGNIKMLSVHERNQPAIKFDKQNSRQPTDASGADDLLLSKSTPHN